MGDPAGVGPEICLRALRDQRVTSSCIPIVMGDANILKRVACATDQVFDFPTVSFDEWWEVQHNIVEPVVVQASPSDLSDIKPGIVTAKTGQASFDYIESAIRSAQAGHVAAVSTTPINKKAFNMAGISFPGHTELFAARDETTRWCMMQYSEEITCTFATVHCGYADVPSLLDVQRILDVIELSAEGLRRIRGYSPRIVVCGLNPHAGEQSLFGNGEEERIIIPAIEAARAKGLLVEGPLPPDTAFLPAQRSNADVVVCMYHDQGHIPVKALAFDTAVNTTLGLSIIRTSVDHGTALDIAWQGAANHSSLVCAIELAVKLALSRDESRSRRTIVAGSNKP